MKALLLSVAVMITNPVHSEIYQMGDDRLKELIEVATSWPDDEFVKICHNSYCFYVQYGQLWFTPEDFRYWDRLDLINLSEKNYSFVSNYDDGEISFYEKKPPIDKPKKEPKDNSGVSGNVGSNNTVGSNNHVSFNFGNSDSDRGCRSCHPDVHPGFGQKSDSHNR